MNLAELTRSHLVLSVVQAPWGRSLSRLCGIGMTSVRARRLQRVLCLTAPLAAIAFASWLALPKPPLLDGISFSQCVRDRSGKLLRVTLTPDQKFRVWTPLQEIAPDLIDATLRYEDKYYARHPGVNPVSLMRSAFGFVRHAGGRSGGSTITMQLARLRFHLHTRTLSGKFMQIVRALEIERHYSKKEILEAYLNLAPYGRNIEGIGAATQIYFDKAPCRITAPEAVALSVIPQRPSRRALLARTDNRSVNLAQRNWYDRAGIQTGAEFSARLFRAQAKPQTGMLAPHFVRQVLETNRSATTIGTTLDLERQQLIERRVRDYISANRAHGIENAAVLLVDDLHTTFCL